MADQHPDRPLRRTLRQRADLRREWVLLSLALLALVAWLGTSAALRRVDHLAHDWAMRLRALPPAPDIALIAIDDASIEAIGRWPWRRALHAQAVAQLAHQAPRAVALDILFGEPDADYPGDDLLLARAIERAGNVVLPVAQRPARSAASAVDAPLAQLREAAAQLGHVQVHVDEDGVVRRVYAREGPQGGPWPHLSLALLCAAGQPQPGCRGHAAPADGPWVRRDPQGITFTAGRPAFATYSYVDLLKGHIAPDALRGKYVLVGATAVGLGDMFAAPAAARTGRVAGVELLAHALHAELAGAKLRQPGRAANLLFNLVPVAAALLALALLGPLAGLLSSALLGVATLLAATLAAPLLGWEFAVAPALAGIALAYPLWSWRRLSAAAHFLQLQMQALQREVPLTPAAPGLAPGLARRYGDALEQRIAAVEDASGRLRRLHHFVSESLRYLPSPTLVCAGDGRVLLANTAAERHLAPPGGGIVGRSAAELLRDLVDPHSGDVLISAEALREGRGPARQEGRDARGRDVLVLCQRHGLEGSTLWLITLVDLSAIRSAQRQRDQALHFISHDIRAPAASILTLLELHREFPGRVPEAQMLQRIERHAQASLAMAQGFVQLASAQADVYQMAPLDLAAALHEAVDEAWAVAQERGVRVRIECAEQPAMVQGDRSLVLRAIGNVLGNAIKFSPDGGAVHCTLRRREGHWCVGVRDEGPGIAPEFQAQVFAPFRGGAVPGVPARQRVGGVGLGLALVDTVMRRHGGSVSLSSEPDQGALLELLLPALDAGEGAPRRE